VPHEVRLPAVGDATDGEVSEWYHPTGHVVQAGEPLVAVDIDKIVIDVPSPAEGVLSIVLPEGSRVAVGDLLGWIIENET
jgi:2-oxoglutarate dehydrogenase E2 component (dihydrolipoamide succinyltransferase)